MPLPLQVGMLTQHGRIVQIDEVVTVWAGDTRAYAADELEPDLGDHVTYLLALEEVARRTELDVTKGFLWYLEPDSGQWILEGSEETRVRDGDTEDPVEALRRALDETNWE